MGTSNTTQPTVAPPAPSATPEHSLRIALLDSWLQHVIDGSGTAAAIGGLERALIARGHSVTRIVPTFDWPRTLTLRRLLYNVQVPALLATLSYDLIVGFDIDGFLWSQRRSDARYVCSVKGVIAEELRHERGWVRGLLWGLSQLERLNVRRAPLVLTTSAYCRRKISEHYGILLQQISIVPEGIDLEHWRTVLRQTEATRDQHTVLCVARQYPRKHVADLLHAFVHVHRRVPLARLVVVGDGPEHHTLRHLARVLALDGIVHFTGAVPDEDVVAWYKRSAIFCLPSVQEGFGIVFLEAMASGLPIVSTTAAAIPEVVPHDKAGLLVPPADPVALADALVALLEDPQRCTDYAAFGQRHVEQFTWGRVAEQFIRAVAEQGE